MLVTTSSAQHHPLAHVNGKKWPPAISRMQSSRHSGLYQLIKLKRLGELQVDHSTRPLRRRVHFPRCLVVGI
jgi:hypothetical protein